VPEKISPPQQLPLIKEAYALFKIGPYILQSSVVLAPMAGITDQPFRKLCRQLGAGMVTSEMLTADSSKWQTPKSQLRLPVATETEPRTVQIAGSEPTQIAKAARLCAEMGAQIIDINMGCPAKKVCRRAAGSALLRDEALVKQILYAAVNAVDIPVTLKIRTGWCPKTRNALTIAKLAEDQGIQALTLHGRTRACLFNGQAEYDTIAEVVASLNIPVIANGDITTPQHAKAVLDKTQAAAVMIGRGAQGQPWVFREIAHYLATGKQATPVSRQQISTLIIEHLRAIHDHYGAVSGVHIARKHMNWYLNKLTKTTSYRKKFNTLVDTDAQIHFMNHTLLTLNNKQDIAA